MSARILWEKGGRAEIVSLTIDAVVLRSTIPSPPGSRISGALEGDTSVVLKVKIHGSKKEDDGAFVLTGRPLDMTTVVREKLTSLL
jgi:hypothetical protein